MSESGSPGRQWSRKWLGVTAAVIVALPVAAYGIWNWIVDDSADAIPTDEVVADFRAGTSVPSPAAQMPTATVPVATIAPTEPEPSVGSTVVASGPTATTAATTATTTVASTSVPPPSFELPAPGVYRYVTTGFEEVDALGGTRHDYPEETTITVTPDGCGVRLRWDALRQRREEWQLCITETGIEVQSDSVQYHEFYDRGEEEPVECDIGVPVVTAEPGAPATVTQDCFRVDEAWLPVWEVVGTETRTVEGQPLEVVHVRQQVVDEDEYWEYTTIDWYLAPSGLPVQVTNVKSSNSPTLVGDVVYDEEYDLRLVSFTPLS